MKRILFKKNLSLLLAIAMVFTFFPAQAFAAAAPTPQEVVAQAIKDSGFTATVKDSTVTVTGSVTNANSPMTIDIPDGVTVEWQATLSGMGGSNSGNISGSDSLLNLTGDGDFVLGSSGKILCTSSTTAIAIEAIGPSLNVVGLVSSTSGPAIFAFSTMDVTISGGLVRSRNMNAICIYSDGTTVTVTGGSVLSDAPMFPAITYTGNSGSMNTIITGGSVQSVLPAQPTDGDGTPVYLVPVKAANAEGVCDISAYLVKSGIGVTYEAQTDADGNAYLLAACRNRDDYRLQ